MEKKISELTIEEFKGIMPDSLEAKPSKELPITRNELAKRLGITPPTIRNLERKGVIPSIRLGYHVRYDWERVMASLNSQK